MTTSSFFALAFMLALSCASQAQPADTAGKVALSVKDARSTGKVTGLLSRPAPSEAAVSAVIIVNSTPGFDGRSAAYARALVDAGMAAMEVDLFQGQGAPASPHHNLLQLHAARQWLAAQPGIDGTRIGVMGFSWGGSVALLASSATLAPAGSERFMAHLALYPVCWRHHAAASGSKAAWPGVTPDAYRRMTGPVHILAGGMDDYDGPAGCQPFLDALPKESRAAFGLTSYPQATFAWDSVFGSAPYEALAHRGRGGIVNVVADPGTASSSRAFAAGFFARHLAKRQN
jgi:uncharacterized protein